MATRPVVHRWQRAEPESTGDVVGPMGRNCHSYRPGWSTNCNTPSDAAAAHDTVLANARHHQLLFPTGAHHELLKSPHVIEAAVWRESREPLIVVIVAIEHHRGAMVIQRLPQRLHRLIVAVATGAEARVMPIGQHTRRATRRQIRTQPSLLRRSGMTPADLITVAVERDQMPLADLETVVAEPAHTGSSARHADAVEIVEVSRSAWCAVLVIARCRPDDRRERPP
jgi:hypothetical protein